MRLQDSFFKVCQCDMDGDVRQYHLTLNASHFIYEAHFPGEPITPGVCIIQMVAELMEREIVEVKNVKFLIPLSPVANPNVLLSFDKVVTDETTGRVRVQATLSSDDALFAKMSVVLK